MGKNKLAKFADLTTFPHVFQMSANEIRRECELEDVTLRLRNEQNCFKPGEWRSAFFQNNHPIVVELGCGRGEYTVELAKMFPQKNFIGVDIKGSRLWTGAKQALDAGLPNVAFLRAPIEYIDRFFSRGEVSEIWLTFSDPQMKKVTKRLTSTYFLERYRKILKDNGLIHLKTDSRFLFSYTRFLLEKNNLKAESDIENLYQSPLSDEDKAILGIQTYYESQWRKRGISIKYLKFRLPLSPALKEPEVEIEMDDYRSYNREKRSSLAVSK